jgi:hypothetical protein
MTTPMPLHLEFTLSFPDYIAAQKLHARRSWWPRLNWFMLHIGFAVWGGLLIVLGFLIMAMGTPLGFVLLCIAGGVFLMGYPFYTRYRLKWCYTQTRNGSEISRVDFEEGSIRYEGPNAKTEYAWSAIRSFAEDASTFALYLAPAKFIIISKRLCTPEQINELRALFQQKVAPAS